MSWVNVEKGLAKRLTKSTSPLETIRIRPVRAKATTTLQIFIRPGTAKRLGIARKTPFHLSVETENGFTGRIALGFGSGDYVCNQYKGSGSAMFLTCTVPFHIEETAVFDGKHTIVPGRLVLALNKKGGNTNKDVKPGSAPSKLASQLAKSKKARLASERAEKERIRNERAEQEFRDRVAAVARQISMEGGMAKDPTTPPSEDAQQTA